MTLANGTLEYLYTIGSSVSLVGMLVALWLSRHDISTAMRGVKLNRRHLYAAAAILVLFIAVEGLVVKPTQQIFFDDVIYQGMAQNLINMGQAWMCNYGTPTACFSGQILHEPVGTALNLAVAFSVFGIGRFAAYGMEFFLAAIAVGMTFMVALLLLKRPRAALLSELFMALSPLVLVWARPTSSDMPTLAYSMVAVFAVLLFAERRNVRTLSFALLSTALVLYMKVDAVLYVPVLLAIYLIVSDRGILDSIKRNARRVYDNIFNTRALLVALLFVLLITPEINYALTELHTGNYGMTGTYIQKTCLAQPWPEVLANSTISLANFGYNICANSLYWFDAYGQALEPQPVLFTAFAMLGIGLLAIYGRWRAAAALGVWFLAFFVLYTSFYAGSVMYGTDWRFMLSVIAPFSILAGAGASYAIGVVEDIAPADRGRERARKTAGYAAVAVVLALIAYSSFNYLPIIGVNPSTLQQAGPARFYENFIYNSISLIPTNCIVYSYDPTLFNINGRAAAQMSYLENTTMYSSLNAIYGCSVLDYGYWCGTPNNICTQTADLYNLSPIVNTTYNSTGTTYTLYRITGVR